MKTDLRVVSDALPRKADGGEPLDGFDAIAKLAESLPRNDKHRGAKLDFSELPGGEKVAGMSGAELSRALKKLEIPGASPNNTKEANVAAYERHLQGLYDEAGEVTILLWFRDHEDEKPDDDDDSEKDDDR